MNHVLTTKVWLLANPSDPEYVEVDLDIDIDINADGALIEGYSVYGKSVDLRSLRKNNPNLDKQVGTAVYNYISNLDKGPEYDPDDVA